MSDEFDYDVDAEAEASAFRPVRVRLRGRPYLLGQTAGGLLRAAKYGESLEGLEADEQNQKLFDILRPTLRALAPDLPEDLSATEEIALLKPVTEVLRRMAKISFRSPDGDGGDEVGGS